MKIHPNGRFLYVTNRADGVATQDGQAIWAGGENSIAVFALAERTGEPRLMQHLSSEGIEARTFAVDPSGTVLIVAMRRGVAGRDEGMQTV